MFDGIKIDQLRMFVACVDYGSFSAAARVLRRAQSAVSQGIQSLENILGIELFDRSQRPPTLTEAGKVILIDARQVIRNVDMLRGHASSISSIAESGLTLAIEQVFPSHLLIETLAELRNSFPHVSATIFTEGIGEPARSLRQGDATVAIWSPSPGEGVGIEMQFLGFVKIVAVAAAGHPLARAAPPIDQAVLEDHIQLSLTNRGREYRVVVLARRTWDFVDQNNRLEFALAGLGWCLMPHHFAEKYLRSGELVELELSTFQGRPILYPIYSAYKIDTPPGPATRWLLDDLGSRFSEWARESGSGTTSDGIQIRVRNA